MTTTTSAPRLVLQWDVVTDERGDRHLVARWVQVVDQTQSQTVATTLAAA